MSCVTRCNRRECWTGSRCGFWAYPWRSEPTWNFWAPSPPAHLDLFLAAGDAIPTLQKASVESEGGALKVLSRAPGDGTVLRTSALLDEREGGDWGPELQSPIPWDDVLFLFTDHLGLTRHKIFTDNVLFRLLEMPRNKKEPQ